MPHVSDLNDEARAIVEARLGRKIPTRTWKKVLNEHDSGRIVSDPEEMRAALADVKSWLRRSVRTSVRRPTIRTAHKIGSVAEAETQASRDTSGLAEVLAVHAAQDPAVQAFRAIYLKGGVLGPEQLEFWLLGRAGDEDRWNENSVFPWPRGPTQEIGYVIPRAIERQTRRLAPQSPLLLPYVLPGSSSIRSIDRRASYALFVLWQIALELGFHYKWCRAEAVTFVLTGTVPAVAHSTARISRHKRFPVLTRLELELDPFLSPDEVIAIYNAARAPLIKPGSRPRDLSEKHRKLAVVGAQHKAEDSKTWRQLMAEWNSQVGTAHPDWTYLFERNFARDCRRAHERLTGLRSSDKGAQRGRTGQSGQ